MTTTNTSRHPTTNIGLIIPATNIRLIIPTTNNRLTIHETNIRLTILTTHTFIMRCNSGEYLSLPSSSNGWNVIELPRVVLNSREAHYCYTVPFLLYLLQNVLCAQCVLSLPLEEKDERFTSEKAVCKIMKKSVLSKINIPLETKAKQK